MGKLGPRTGSSLPKSTESKADLGLHSRALLPLPGPSRCPMAVCISGAWGEGSWVHGASIVEMAGSLDLQVTDEHVVSLCWMWDL